MTTQHVHPLVNDGRNTTIMTTQHVHPLVKSSRNTDWLCDGRHQSGGCRRSGHSDGKGTSGLARYRCEPCDFDFCESCLTAYRPAAETTIMTTQHVHPLVKSSRNTDWLCDGRHQSGGCRRSGHSDGKGTSGLARYRCEPCDFDFCESCLTAYRPAAPSKVGITKPFEDFRFIWKN
jgi:transposase-like protein